MTGGMEEFHNGSEVSPDPNSPFSPVTAEMS